MANIALQGTSKPLRASATCERGRYDDADFLSSNRTCREYASLPSSKRHG